MEKIFLNNQEERDLERLTKEYEKFLKPSLINKTTTTVKDALSNLTPEIVKSTVKNRIDTVSEAEVWKQVMKMAADGFIVLQGVSAKYSINENDIVKKFQKIDNTVVRFDDFKMLRGYEIEKVVNSIDIGTYLTTILHSAPTGAVGIWGLPFNIVLSIFVQYRTVQLIAMHYGYDIKKSTNEMEFAGAVLLEIISKGKITDTGGINEIIAKMMTQAELTSLKSALTRKTYEQMALEGGIQQLYVQIRAITNKAAMKALNKANAKEIENTFMKKILEALSKKMTQKVGAKSIPIVSAVLSVLIDTHQINKVLKMANIIYHKRFLIDKVMTNSDFSIKTTSFIDDQIIDIE